MLFFFLLLAAPVPRGALLDDPASAAVVARARQHSEPLRAVIEYGSAIAAMTLVNAGGSALLSNASVDVSRTGSVSLQGSTASLALAGTCFALSPLAAAITAWAVGKGSDEWSPSLGWTTLGAYGSSALAIGAGLGMSAAGMGHDAAVIANGALYLAVPLGTVLVENATKSPR